MPKGNLLKKIIGGVEIAAGVATGNPMMAIQGAGQLAGGFAGDKVEGAPGEVGPTAQGAAIPTTPPPNPYDQIDRTRNEAARQRWTGE